VGVGLQNHVANTQLVEQHPLREGVVVVSAPLDGQPDQVVHQNPVRDAYLGAWVLAPPPLRYRRRLEQLVGSLLDKIPMSVAVRLLPIDHLSRGVCEVMPSLYRSPTMWPFQVTRKAAVMACFGSKAASTAALSLSASRAEGNGVSGSVSPTGQAWVEGSGRRLVTFVGVKCSMGSGLFAPGKALGRGKS
jgi:hypothetical protein